MNNVNTDSCANAYTNWWTMSIQIAVVMRTQMGEQCQYRWLYLCVHKWVNNVNTDGCSNVWTNWWLCWSLYCTDSCTDGCTVQMTKMHWCLHSDHRIVLICTALVHLLLIISNPVCITQSHQLWNFTYNIRGTPGFYLVTPFIHSFYKRLPQCIKNSWNHHVCRRHNPVL